MLNKISVDRLEFVPFKRLASVTIHGVLPCGEILLFIIIILIFIIIFLQRSAQIASM